MSDDPLFDWGNEYVRPSDPDTSHEAALELDEASSSFEAYGFFVQVAAVSSDGVTAAEFEQYVNDSLISEGWDQERAYRKGESLRRRLTELRKKYGLIEVRYDEVKGKPRKRKRGGQQILYLVEKGGAGAIRGVLESPLEPTGVEVELIF